MATVASLVFLPRITSTSGICRTGLKKCSPQNRSGCFSPSASCVIGIVEVFDARIASSRSSGSSRAKSCCLASRFSMIASTMRSRVAELDVGERAVHQRREFDGPLHIGAFDLLVVRQLRSARPARRERAASRLESMMATGMPRFTLAAAMPCPITPAPTTPADVILCGSTPLATPGSFLLRSREEKHVEQRSIDRRAEELGEFLGFHLAGRFEIDAGGAEHQLERRERGRVVALGLLLDVRARRRAEEAELRVADRRSAADQRSRSRRKSPDCCSARIMRIAAASSRSRSPPVATTSLARPIARPRAGVDVLAAGDQLDRVRKADHPRRARGAAPAGKQAELHFRKAVGGFLACRS